MISTKVLKLESTKKVSLHFTRNLSTINKIAEIQPQDLPSSVPKMWDTVVNEAEKVVGYPTSFLNLRWLLSDEFANVAVHMRKMVGNHHPLLKTVKNLLFQNDFLSWGLIVLLVAKAGGLNTDFPDVERDVSAGVLHTQRSLAEITEMLRTSNRIHRAMFNIEKTTEHIGDMHVGNKMALLSGDYLLSSSFQNLANLRNQEIHELMSTAVRDLAANEFLGLRDSQNKPLPSKRTGKIQKIREPGKKQTDRVDMEPFDHADLLGNTRAEWTLRSMLGGGSLLARACQCNFKLANYSEDIQRNGYLIGKHVALAWQAHDDMKPFNNEGKGSYSLVSAPVLFHLDYDPNAYTKIECGLENVDDVDYEGLKCAIIDGPALEGTSALQREHANIAIELIEKLPEPEARNALSDIMTCAFTN